MSLRFSEDQIADLVKRGGARVRDPSKPAPIAPAAAPAPVVRNEVVVDMAEVAAAIERSQEGMTDALIEMARTIAASMAAFSSKPDGARPPPIKGAVATVMSTDANGNPSKIKFEFQR